MPRPIGRADLLGDQGVAGGVVGRAQQGFGQAHQRQALRRAERVFGQEALHHPAVRRAPARGDDQRFGFDDRGRPFAPGQRLAPQEGRDGVGLVEELAVIERVPIHARQMGARAPARERGGHIRSRGMALSCSRLNTSAPALRATSRSLTWNLLAVAVISTSASTPQSQPSRA